MAAAFELYLDNEFLREIINTGAFCFADGYFTHRDEKYVLPKENGFTLTDYAKEHLSECTIDFSYKLVGGSVADGNAICMLRSDREYKKQPTFDSHDPQNIEVYNRAREIRTKFDEQYSRFQLVAETTTQRMRKYMEHAKWNVTIFQEKTLLNPLDYYRVQKGEHKFQVPSYTAMAVGLGLTLEETQAALRLSALDFDKNIKAENAYVFVMSNFPGCTMDEFNTHLQELDVAPIVRKSKKSPTVKKRKSIKLAE